MWILLPSQGGMHALRSTHISAIFPGSFLPKHEAVIPLTPLTERILEGTLLTASTLRHKDDISPHVPSKAAEKPGPFMDTYCAIGLS